MRFQLTRRYYHGTWWLTILWADGERWVVPMRKDLDGNLGYYGKGGRHEIDGMRKYNVTYHT